MLDFFEKLQPVFFDSFALMKMVFLFCVNFFVVWLVIHFFYYPKARRHDFYFTYVLLASSIFMMIYLMDGSKMEVGAALGLFAVFGILRYRTESVPIREMTYLFFVVAISVVNAATPNLSGMEHIASNLLFLMVVYLAEHFLIAKKEGCKFVQYDNIELITPDRRDELIADLEKRLGLKVLRVEVGAVDFIKDLAMLRVYYDDPDANRIKSIDRTLKFPKAPDAFDSK